MLVKEKFLNDKKNIWYGKNLHHLYKQAYTPWKWHQAIFQKAKELGITDLQHAQNGGEHYVKELGYWLDGYSPEKNIVIEYYEDRHRRQVEKDNQRQKEIMELYGLSEEQFVIICESKGLEKYRDSIATSDSLSRSQTSP